MPSGESYDAAKPRVAKGGRAFSTGLSARGALRATGPAGWADGAW